MKSYLKKYHKFFGAIGAVIAFAIAVLYLFIVPSEAANTGLMQKNVLTYGHSVCWLLLGIASTLWAVKMNNRWSVALSYGALAVYAIFIGTLLSVDAFKL